MYIKRLHSSRDELTIECINVDIETLKELRELFFAQENILIKKFNDNIVKSIIQKTLNLDDFKNLLTLSTLDSSQLNNLISFIEQLAFNRI